MGLALPSTEGPSLCHLVDGAKGGSLAKGRERQETKSQEVVHSLVIHSFIRSYSLSPVALS